MINSEKSFYLQETEQKPNNFALLVLLFFFFGMGISWLLTEIGVFRVGLWEMRIGAGVPCVSIAVVTVVFAVKREWLSHPATKWFLFSISSLVIFAVTTLLTFHTTMMLLFPIFFAMLYRSEKIGRFAVGASVFCTVAAPITSYAAHLWDVPLFEEMILIATGKEPEVFLPVGEVNAVGVGKILLYLVFPHLIMVGSCALLMFYIIRLSVQHLNNQILLDKLNRHDALTGLYNQNFYKQVAASKNYRGQVGVVFFDVNDLKLANDTHGHEYGDLLLKRSAKSLLDVCDGEKIHGFRLGGDEFLLILEDADVNDVSATLSSWKDALAAVNRENETAYGGLVCSMAFGYVVGNFEDLDELVHRADRKMYAYKAKMKDAEPMP